MKRFLLFLVLLSVSFASYAERVRGSVAKNVAETMLPKTELKDLSPQTNFNNFYIFSSDNGFVIVSADDRTSPIIAYSDKNPFAVKDMSVNVYEWLKNVDKGIQGLIDDKVVASETVKAEWKSFAKGEKPSAKYRSAVEPLIKTQWGQSFPFNSMCPMINEEQAVAGCVATAMAQIMKYWEWPHRGVGEHSYAWGHIGELAVNFDETLYDWDNMLYFYDFNYGEASGIAVATLMYHCGISVDMMYGLSENGGSAAYSEDVVDALKDYFNYDPNLQYVYKYYYTDEKWKDLLKTELNAGRPVYYAGDDGQAGHAFVCDGYDANDYFHFNWGWGGYCDGYYLIGNLAPGTGGIGSGNGSYNNNNIIIIGVQPNPATPRINAPTNLAAEVDFPNATITWLEVTDADCYKVYRDDRFVAKVTDNSYTDMAPGQHVYYVKSVAEDEMASVDSETIAVETLYPGPEMTNLVAERYDVNNVSLTWTTPASENYVLKYGEEPYSMGYGILFPFASSDWFLYGCSYWGHKFPKEELSAHAGKAIVSVETMINEDPEVGSRQYELQIYTEESVWGTEGGTFSAEKVYAQEFTYTSDFNDKWFTVTLDTPFVIDYSKDILIIFHPVDDGDFVVPVSSDQGGNTYSHVYSSDGIYFEDQDAYSAPGTLFGEGVSFLIRTHITDGAYTYNVYRDGEKIANEIKENSYDDTDLEFGVYEYSVETNYFGGSAKSENIIVELSESEEYTVSVSVNPEDAGVVEGGGTYFETTYVTVKATPNLGYAFKEWTENGIQVSTDASYKFKIAEDRNLVAEFIDNDLSIEVVNVTSPSCEGESDGAIEVMAKSGLSPYIYKLGDETSEALDTSYTFENLTVGTYVIEVADATGFSVTTTVEVKASDEELEAGAIATEGEEIAVGESASVIASAQDATGPGKLTYRWKMNGEVLENSNSAQYTPSAESLAVGKYVFTREVKNNCTDWIASEGEWTLFVRTNSIPVPKNVKAVASGTTIKLSWDLVPVALAYGIMYEGEFVGYTENELVYYFEGLAPATTYCFTVVTIVEEGYSDPSEEVCATTAGDGGGDDTEVLPPSNVKAVAISSTTIRLSWDPVPGALAYGIMNGGDLIGATYETYMDIGGALPNSTYCFTVVSVTGIDNEGYITDYSEESEKACATTGSGSGGDDTEVLPPSNVKAVATSSTTIRLSWDPVPGALAYGIMYEDDFLGATDETVAEFEELLPNTTYCFKVFTITEVDAEGYIIGYSEDSEEVCATTTVPDAVDEVTATFYMYPNPVEDKLYIETDVEIEDIVVYDVYGRQQDNVAIRKHFVDVSDLTSGIYLIKIVTNGSGFIRRFVKK